MQVQYWQAKASWSWIVSQLPIIAAVELSILIIRSKITKDSWSWADVSVHSYFLTNGGRGLSVCNVLSDYVVRKFPPLLWSEVGSLVEFLCLIGGMNKHKGMDVRGLPALYRPWALLTDVKWVFRRIVFAIAIVTDIVSRDLIWSVLILSVIPVLTRCN